MLPYNRLNSTWQAMNKYPYLTYQGQNSICSCSSIISLTQYDYKNTMLNSKIHCKSKNMYNTIIATLITFQSCWWHILLNVLLNYMCGTAVMYHSLSLWSEVCKYYNIHTHYITLHFCWNSVNILVNHKCGTSVMCSDW